MESAPAAPKYTFTVFTATRNRAHTLPRVYESLKSQTFRDFEWLIVDNLHSFRLADAPTNTLLRNSVPGSWSQ